MRSLIAMIVAVIAAQPAAAQSPGASRQAFYAAPTGWTDALYASVGGQWARLGGLQLSTDGTCGADNDLFAVCGAGADLGSSSGGGFRVELGSVVRSVRPYISFAGNYGWHPTGAFTAPFVANSASADAQAHTLIFGVGLDSARLVPALLPPNLNLFIQGGIGVSWNRLSNARAVFPTGVVEFDLPSTTTTRFAGEVGAGVEYALTPSLALRAGYNSRWIGRFRSEGVTTITASGAALAFLNATTPIVFQPVQSDSVRVDEVYAAVVIRFGDLLRR